MTEVETRDYDRGLRILSRVTAAVFATFVFAVILFLLLFQWNWLRGPIGRAASARLEREVRLVGDLDVALLRAHPEARINDLRVADAPWRGANRPMAQVQRLTIATRWTDLLTGRVTFPLIQADRPDVVLFRDARGRENWRFSDEPDDGSPTDIPPINNLVINNGRLTYRDLGRNMSLDATMNSSERVSQGGEGRFRLSGQGRVRTEPFLLNVTGGPLVNVRRDRPYPLTADIRAGATRLTARGQIDRPFDLGQLRATLTLQGPDLADVYDVTGRPAQHAAVPDQRHAGARQPGFHLQRFPRHGRRQRPVRQRARPDGRRAAPRHRHPALSPPRLRRPAGGRRRPP